MAVLVLAPGPNTVLIVAHSIAGGRRVGLATVAGIELGTIAHTLAAAFGLSTLLAASPPAFDVVQKLGAAILVLLGARELSRTGAPPGVTAATLTLRRGFARALLGNLLNPKVAIFFLAFLPQWVDLRRGAILPQFLVLGAIVVAVGALSGSVVALTAGGLARRWAHNETYRRWQSRVSGIVLVGLGLWVAVQRRI